MIILKHSSKFMLGAAFLTTACMQTPELDVSPGTPVTATNVQQALLRAWGDVDPATLNLNEFVAIDQEQSLPTGESRIGFQVGTTVLEKTPTPDVWKIKLAQQKKEFTSDGTKLSTIQRDFELPRTVLDLQALKAEAIRQSALNGTPETPSIFVRNDFPLSIEWLTGLLYSCVATPDFQSSCYNLRSSEELVDAPALVRQTPDCGGLANCKMNLKRVAFDVVVVTKEKETKEEKQKVRYNIAFSPDLPFLSRLYEYCFQGLISLKPNTPKILIKICNRVVNFQRGQTQTTPPTEAISKITR